MRNRLNKALCWLMMLVVSSVYTMADVNAARMRPEGTVSLNGNSADRASAIFAGDKLLTGADSTAAITVRGSTVLIAANSAVTFGDNSVDLGRGTAVVTTSRGMSARLRGVTVAPAGENTVRFRVSDESGTAQVAALAGPLVVTPAAGTPTVLQPGAAMALADSDGVGAGSANAGWLSEDKSILIAVLGAIAAGLIIAAVNAGDDDESPVVP